MCGEGYHHLLTDFIKVLTKSNGTEQKISADKILISISFCTVSFRSLLESVAHKQHRNCLEMKPPSQQQIGQRLKLKLEPQKKSFFIIFC
jgi:hypothetical protein